MTTFFTSDTHFGHANIIAYCKRPFASVEDMDEALIERWNARVASDDVVYHLGDFAFYKPDGIRKIRSRLNGEIRLVLGNHDRTAHGMLKCGFETVQKNTVIALGECVNAVLRHEPPTDDIRWYDNAVWLCGHVHEKWAERRAPSGRIINVGVDVRGFQPVTWEELRNG